MQWKLFANLAETADRKEIDVDAGEAATVREALDALFDRHPDLRSVTCTDEGDLKEHIRLLVDGADPFAEGDGYDTELDADAELALFPPVSGG